MKAPAAISVGALGPTSSIFLEASLKVIQVGIMMLRDRFSNRSKLRV